MRYASCFAAMLMGRSLLHDLGRPLAQLDHLTFAEARKLIETKGDKNFEEASAALQAALAQLYRDQPISLQRLSATFRRGDLFQYLLPTAPSGQGRA